GRSGQDGREWLEGHDAGFRPCRIRGEEQAPGRAFAFDARHVAGEAAHENGETGAGAHKMSCTTDPEALFRVCLQDLRAGRLLGVEQLPEIAARVGSPLADEITELTRVYQDEIAQLQELGGAGE